MIITKRLFKLEQVLMKLEPRKVSAAANKRDSLIKMGREAGVEAPSGRVQASAFSHLDLH